MNVILTLHIVTGKLKVRFILLQVEANLSKYKILSERYKIRIEFIPREKNKLADQLSRGDTKHFDKLFYNTAVSEQQGFINELINKVASVFLKLKANTEMQKETYKILIELKSVYLEQLNTKDCQIEKMQEQLVQKDNQITEKDNQICTLLLALTTANQPHLQESRSYNATQRFKH